jgi:hypothetical protein
VGDARLVHNIRILSGEIDHHDLGAEDQVKNVLYDRAFLPNIIERGVVAGCQLDMNSRLALL